MLTLSKTNMSYLDYLDTLWSGLCYFCQATQTWEKTRATVRARKTNARAFPFKASLACVLWWGRGKEKVQDSSPSLSLSYPKSRTRERGPFAILEGFIYEPKSLEYHSIYNALSRPHGLNQPVSFNILLSHRWRFSMLLLIFNMSEIVVHKCMK